MKQIHKSKLINTIISTLFLSAFIILSASINCDAAAGDRRNLLGEGTDYTSILYDSNNGLPTSEANAIAQSSDGFIWLGGYSGLIRYDGTEFYRFDSSTGISSVFSLYVDSKDRIWIGTNENGIAYYDHGELKVYGKVEGMKSYSIRAISEDTEGNILVATTQGLCVVGNDDLQIHAVDDPQVNTEYITRLVRANDGRVYGLTLDGAVFVADGQKIQSFYNANTFGNDPVNTIYPDPENDNILYMGTTESELLKVDVSNSMAIIDHYSVDPQKNISAIYKVNNILWVSSTNGIGYIDENKKYYKMDDLELNNSVGNIMSDHEGNMWFTSTRQGVLKLVPDRFTDISKMAGLESTVVNSTCVKDGNLYLATDGGLVILNNDTYEPITNELTKYLEDIRIRCITKDSDDNLWFCTHGDTGIVCQKKNGTIISLNQTNGLDAEKARSCIQCADGSIAATTNNGAFIIKNDKVTAHYGHDDGISNTEILCACEGPDGKLYLGSDGEGIYVVDDGKVSRISFDDGLTSGVIMQIKWDEKYQMFWIITSNSIEYMKDGKLTAIDKFPYSNNLDIYFNSGDGAWVLSSNGVYITKVDQLIANDSIEYSFYNTRSGLPYITTGNSRSYLDEDGHLYISGTTGVCMVNINAAENDASNVKLAVPFVEIDDREVPVNSGEAVELPAGSKRLVINAYAITYGLNNPRITYYLDGFDKEPISTTKQDLDSIIYTNLDGGKYVFHINAINDETGKVEKTMAVAINKENSAYENFWFWIISMGIIIALIAYAIWNHFKKRNEALLEKQEEDRLFISEIMHTFAKCIDMRDSQNRGHSFRVAYYTRMLAEKLREKRGYTDEQIEEFYNIALLHDIGKLSIPDKILNKPARLDDDEFVIMKSHAANGRKILSNVKIVENLAVGAGCHHERIDGKGYPNGLKGDEIPEVARIIAVADTFDAMYSTRPYRKQMLLSDVLNEIKRIKGTQLEDDVVDALLALAEENKLDKDEVDKATAYDLEDENELVHETDKLSDDEEDAKNKEFMKSIGLSKD